MSIARDLVERLDALQTTEVDLRRARTLLLDHLAVVANGSRTDSARSAQQLAAAMGSAGGARFPIIGTDADAPVPYATIANGVAGHSIEFDDTHSASSSHPGVVVFPAALGAATMVGAEASEMLRGAIVGYEAMCRVGRAADPPAQYAAHFHPTATTGTIGAAVAAASIFELSVDQTVSAIGIAATMAAGSMQFLEDGAWTKRLHPGAAARNGLEAATLARFGFQGTEDGLGGARGFLATYTRGAHPERILENWGHRPLEVHSTGIKAHTCCRYNQAPIDAVLQLRSDHNLAVTDVAGIQVGVPGVAVDIVAAPLDHKRRPESIVDAQFSLPFAIAAAFFLGRAGLAEFTTANLASPPVLDIMDRVSYHIDPSLDAAYPEHWGASVRIETVDGRVLEARVADPKGDPGNPFTERELEAKFHALTQSIYGDAHRQELIDCVRGLGASATLSDLVAQFPADGRS
jgi:2-methylcitrate dehydratase PrpD